MVDEVKQLEEVGHMKESERQNDKRLWDLKHTEQRLAGSEKESESRNMIVSHMSAFEWSPNAQEYRQTSAYRSSLFMLR